MQLPLAILFVMVLRPLKVVPTTSVAVATYEQAMLAGAEAYRMAWVPSVANNSVLFRDQILICMRHFNRALEAVTATTSSGSMKRAVMICNTESSDSSSCDDSNDMRDTAFWNLAISIAYMQSRSELVDRYKEPLAQSWQDSLLRSLQARPRKGALIELGVGKGFTARFISDVLEKGSDNRPLFGFDSFQGLPQVWGGEGSTISKRYPRKSFDLKGKAPYHLLPEKMILSEGWFSETLPNFALELRKSGTYSDGIAFVHVDCDLYTSTFEALASIVCLLRRGTVIAFDEAKGYLEWKSAGEWRAFTEIADLYGIKWEGVAHFKMRVGVRVLNDIRGLHPTCASYIDARE